MKASRLIIPGGQFSRGSESSSVEGPKRRSSNTSSKTKKICKPSTAKSPNKCPPVLCRKGHSPEPDAFAHAVTNAHVYPSVHPLFSDHDQLANDPSQPDCRWPNWPDWGSEIRSEQCDASGPRSRSNYSYTSSSCSYSDSDSDLRWSSSSSASGSTRVNRVREPREELKSCSFWEDFIWGERRPWVKLQHHKAFLTNIWGSKPETKVKESSQPILVSVNVPGSPGPLRILVDKNDSVQNTVDVALRRYTAQKRQPALVEPISCFGLYCRNPDFEALDDEAKIGHHKSRQFHLYRKQRMDPTSEDTVTTDGMTHKSGGAIGGATSLAPIRTWTWNNVSGWGSWAWNFVVGITCRVTLCVKYWNLGRLYRFIFILSVKALSLGVI